MNQLIQSIPADLWILILSTQSFPNLGDYYNLVMAIPMKLIQSKKLNEWAQSYYPRYIQVQFYVVFYHRNGSFLESSISNWVVTPLRRKYFRKTPIVNISVPYGTPRHLIQIRATLSIGTDDLPKVCSINSNNAKIGHCAFMYAIKVVPYRINSPHFSKILYNIISENPFSNFPEFYCHLKNFPVKKKLSSKSEEFLWGYQNKNQKKKFSTLIKDILKKKAKLLASKLHI